MAPLVFAGYPKLAVKSSLKVSIQARIEFLSRKGPTEDIYYHLCNDFKRNLCKRKQ